MAIASACRRFIDSRMAACVSAASMHWDVLRIWSEIQNGLKKFRALQSSVPAGIGVDAWGVDYCLLDDRDRLLGESLSLPGRPHQGSCPTHFRPL